MRRLGFLVTLAAGFGLLGASLHGITNVDRTLQVMDTPQRQTLPVIERSHHDCHRGHDHPRV
jgi:hypothetical protein